MSAYDDVLESANEFVNRGVDAAFPARKIARTALLSKTQAPLQTARDANKNEFDKGMVKGANINATARDIPEHWGTAVNKAIMPKYAKAVEEADKARTENRPKSKGKFDPTGLDKDYKTGGKVASASKRADGIAAKGKTRGRLV